MENIDHITAVLRDGMTPEQMSPILPAEAALLEKVQKLCLAQKRWGGIRNFSNDSRATSRPSSSRASWPVIREEQNAKSRQLYDAMLTETQQTLANAGLPADYQTLPIFNFSQHCLQAEAEESAIAGGHLRAGARQSRQLSHAGRHRQVQGVSICRRELATDGAQDESHHDGMPSSK